MPTILATLPSGIRARIVVEPAPGCWLWKGAVHYGGYGTYTARHGDKRYAHRMVYELLVGPIPDGLDLDHLCRVRSCVNPDHLEPVTRRENLLRGETDAARRAAMTACERGHPFTPENTYVKPSGARECRPCRRARVRRWRERIRSAA
jgi:hypothetical protein